MLKNVKLNGSMKTYNTFQNEHPRDVLFITGDWNAKVGSQELSRVIGKFGRRVQNKAGQRLTNRVLPRECTGHSKHPVSTTQIILYTWTSPDGNTDTRLIIFFAAKVGQALYSQQKQDQELTVSQIINSLLPNSDSN